MNCLLIAATAGEIAPFLSYYRDTPKLFHVDLSIDVLVTGAGLTATTYHLSRHLRIRRPDLVIQGGIAGSFDKKQVAGTVVAVKQEAIADEGVMERTGYRSLFDMGLAGKNQFPYKNGWLVNPGTVLLKRSGLKLVKGVSVNQVTTGAAMINRYRERFGAVTESMEGAALHYVCLMENIPFLQVRAISNAIGVRDKKKWKMNEAIDNLNRELIRLLELL
jgi:futalosine hydrolase